MTDNPRRVFKVPVEYTVKADLYVLATDLTAARIAAEQSDLEDLIGFDTTQLWIEDDKRLKVNDIEVHDIYTIEAKPIDRVDYDPSTHPDWTNVLRS